MERVCPFCGADIPDLPPGTPGDTLECPVCGQTQDRAVQPDTEPAQAGAPQNPQAPPPLPPPAAACDGMASFQDQVLPPDMDLEAPPIPWEGDRGFFGSLFGTIGQVLFHPGQAFAAPGRPGLAWPLAYALILGTLGLGGSLVVESLTGESPLPRNALVWLLVFSPLIALVIQFISSGICHLCLIITRGNKRGFQPTFRVVAYATTTGLWLLIPWVGFYIALVWDIVVGTEGLSKAHGISRAKAFWTWVMPYLFLLLLIFLFAAAMAGRMMGNYHDLLERFR
jgi:hypothetical protein